MMQWMIGGLYLESWENNKKGLFICLSQKKYGNLLFVESLFSLNVINKKAY